MLDQDLWESYWRDKTPENRNKILEYHWEWAQGYVSKILKRRGQSRHEGDVLSQVSEHILTRSIPGFHACGVSFRRHLMRHIRRAVSEALRSGDGRKRRSCERAAKVHQARDALGNVLGRRPTDAEVAEALNIPESEVISDQRVPEVQLECLAGSSTEDGFELLIEGLDCAQKELLRLYYVSRYTEEEIGQIIGCSRKSVSEQLVKLRGVLLQRSKD